jgi:helicase-like protein
VVVVDEEIYRLLPGLLIATVDKFAQMPWNGAVQMLFGQVSGRCTRHGFRSPELRDSDTHPRRGALPAAHTEECGPLRPPDLIIQDELHLIGGPLGTLVGLYESAIDRLTSWEVGGRRVRPKVIASTATIRRAPHQIHALFLRQVRVFPPQGVDIQDNFFSRQRPPSPAFPGRRYLGICAPGRRIKQALIRVYVAQMAAAQALYERYGRAADPWMTLVGYFNAMRELAGMVRLVNDDVRSRLASAEARGLAKRQPPFMEELTSRRGSTDIPRILDLLDMAFAPEDDRRRTARRKEGRPVDKARPLDVLLATNMISVGVDVKRLGMMVVGGQPKTTAEYIQATSRVGRAYPGLVLTVSTGRDRATSRTTSSSSTTSMWKRSPSPRSRPAPWIAASPACLWRWCACWASNSPQTHALGRSRASIPMRSRRWTCSRAAPPLSRICRNWKRSCDVNWRSDSMSGLRKPRAPPVGVCSATAMSATGSLSGSCATQT